MSERSVLLVYADLRSGGLAVDIRNTANGLVERGWRVGVATARSGDVSGKALGLGGDVGLHELSVPLGPVGRTIGAASGIRRLIRRGAWDVVHVSSLLPLQMHAAAMRAARDSLRTLVWTPMTHPMRERYWTTRARTRPLRRFDRYAAPHAARLTDAIAAATEEEAEWFSRLGARLVRVIPPGVESAGNVLPGDVGAFRRRHGLGAHPVVLTVAARNERRKGMDFALAAFGRLRSLILSVRLVAVGTSFDGEPPEGVVATGRLSEDELATAYAAADVAFVPSRYEAFSRVVIEAWQQETPVVVSDGVGLRRVVESLDNVVVSFGDAEGAADRIASLLEDPALAVKLGRRGSEEVARHYLLPEILDETARMYEDAERARTA
ncbi:MAG: glycosyltransferase family 4 protein [Actinomycetota bacterium]